MSQLLEIQPGLSYFPLVHISSFSVQLIKEMCSVTHFSFHNKGKVMVSRFFCYILIFLLQHFCIVTGKLNLRTPTKVRSPGVLEK